MMEALAEPGLTRRAPVRTLRSLEATPEAAEVNDDAEDDAIASRVLAALMDRSTRRRGRERRSERRYPYPHPIYLTPLTSAGPQIDETVQVIGKHLSEHGLDFYHREPLPYRRMIASLQVGGEWLGLVLDLKWCRFTTDGLYDNGGRFVDTVPSPLAAP
jgi:hypothetical protein